MLAEQLDADPWYVKDTNWCINFLRYWGSVLGVENVRQKYSEVLKWRREYGVNDLLSEKSYQPEVECIEVLQLGVHTGKARNNGLIYVERYGAMDPERLMALDDEAGFVYMLFRCEEFFSKSMSHRRQHQGCAAPTVLVDLDGLSWSHLYSGGVMRVVAWTRQKQKYYSHTPGQKVYICGVSSVVMWIWDFTKDWLNKPVAESVVFLPTDRMHLLLERIEPDSIPQWCYQISPELASAAAALRAHAASAASSGGGGDGGGEAATVDVLEWQRGQWRAKLGRLRAFEQRAGGRGALPASVQRDVDSEKARLKALVDSLA